jgi:hypothetical protein
MKDVSQDASFYFFADVGRSPTKKALQKLDW